MKTSMLDLLSRRPKPRLPRVNKRSDDQLKDKRRTSSTAHGDDESDASRSPHCREWSHSRSFGEDKRGFSSTSRDERSPPTRRRARSTSASAGRRSRNSGSGTTPSDRDAGQMAARPRHAMRFQSGDQGGRARFRSTSLSRTGSLRGSGNVNETDGSRPSRRETSRGDRYRSCGPPQRPPRRPPDSDGQEPRRQRRRSKSKERRPGKGASRLSRPENDTDKFYWQRATVKPRRHTMGVTADYGGDYDACGRYPASGKGPQYGANGDPEPKMRRAQSDICSNRTKRTSISHSVMDEEGGEHDGGDDGDKITRCRNSYIKGVQHQTETNRCGPRNPPNFAHSNNFPLPFQQTPSATDGFVSGKPSKKAETNNHKGDSLSKLRELTMSLRRTNDDGHQNGNNGKEKELWKPLNDDQSSGRHQVNHDNGAKRRAESSGGATENDTVAARSTKTDRLVLTTLKLAEDLRQRVESGLWRGEDEDDTNGASIRSEIRPQGIVPTPSLPEKLPSRHGRRAENRAGGEGEATVGSAAEAPNGIRYPVPAKEGPIKFSRALPSRNSHAELKDRQAELPEIVHHIPAKKMRSDTLLRKVSMSHAEIKYEGGGVPLDSDVGLELSGSITYYPGCSKDRASPQLPFPPPPPPRSTQSGIGINGESDSTKIINYSDVTDRASTIKSADFPPLPARARRDDFLPDKLPPRRGHPAVEHEDSGERKVTAGSAAEAPNGIRYSIPAEEGPNLFPRVLSRNSRAELRDREAKLPGVVHSIDTKTVGPDSFLCGSSLSHAEVKDNMGLVLDEDQEVAGQPPSSIGCRPISSKKGTPPLHCFPPPPPRRTRQSGIDINSKSKSPPTKCIDNTEVANSAAVIKDTPIILQTSQETLDTVPFPTQNNTPQVSIKKAEEGSPFAMSNYNQRDSFLSFSGCLENYGRFNKNKKQDEFGFQINGVPLEKMNANKSSTSVQESYNEERIVDSHDCRDHGILNLAEKMNRPRHRLSLNKSHALRTPLSTTQERKKQDIPKQECSTNIARRNEQSKRKGDTSASTARAKLEDKDATSLGGSLASEVTDLQKGCRQAPLRPIDSETTMTLRYPPPPGSKPPWRAPTPTGAGLESLVRMPPPHQPKDNGCSLNRSTVSPNQQQQQPHNQPPPGPLSANLRLRDSNSPNSSAISQGGGNHNDTATPAKIPKHVSAPSPSAAPKRPTRKKCFCGSASASVVTFAGPTGDNVTTRSNFSASVLAASAGSVSACQSISCGSEFSNIDSAGSAMNGRVKRSNSSAHQEKKFE